MSLPEPITRKEQYYDGIAKGNASKLPEPITREEQYLEYIAKNGGGGGGGTTDYEALDNKPSVNSVELSGNKTLDDLGIQGKLTFDNEPTEGSQNPVKSGGVYEALESLDEAISRKPDEYADLTDKPSINSVELSGNKTASDLGLQAELDGAQTVEGNPITITDAEAMNAESVVVELEPKQDLHGYDAPWVGGSGKNKLPIINTTRNVSGVDYTVNPNGTITTDGTATALSYFVLTNDTNDLNTLSNIVIPKGTTIIASSGVSNDTLHARYVGATYFDLPNDTPFTLEDDVALVYIAVSSGVTIDEAVYSPMIRLATETDPTFAPYSNICPITGYSEVNVERVGKNLFDKTTATTQAYIRSSGAVYPNGNWRLSDYVRIKDEQFYTMSVVRMQSAGYYAVCFYDENKEYVGGYEQETEATHVTCQAMFDKPSVYARFCVHVENLNNFMFELGNQATTYEPYQGSTATISLGGTKYGGTLDVTEGGYSDEWTEVVARSSNTDGEYQISENIVRIRIPNIPEINNAICSHFEYANSWDGDFAHFFYNSYEIFLYIPATSIQDAKDYLEAQYNAGTPITICAKLVNSTTSSTTPTDIPLLENTNNISTDGTNIELKYQPNNVIGECKVYTDEQCAKVLPPLPTTDGTYHLSCEVTSGVGVLSWVSDN